MDLSLSETQRHLSDAVGTFLGRLDRYEMPVTPPTGPDNVWRALGEDLGLLSLMASEEAGGFGGRGEDLLAVMEAMGRHLLPQPFAETAVVASSLLQASDSAQASHLLQAIATGEVHVGTIINNDALVADLGDDGQWRVTGDCGLVYPAPSAGVFVVRARSGTDNWPRLFLISSEHSEREIVATIDERWAGRVTFKDAPASLILEGRVAEKAILKAEDVAIAALCAEASGVLSRLLDDTVEFSKQRRQFGQPIGRFQVLQHRMADMLMHYEMARSAAILACLSLEDDASKRRQATSAAKITISEACRFIGQNAIQLHGGLGMSAETEITRWFKRATVIEYQMGSRDFHLDRYRGAA